MLIVLLILAVAFIVVSTTKFKLHPFLALIFAAIGFGLLSGMPFAEIVSSVNSGFGDIVGHIGLVIVIGCIIGTFLEESGGAYVMAQGIVRLAGKKRVPLAMLIVGSFISIPVYADSGFVILSPLNKAITKKSGISLACTAIALSLGLTITHCLVPPTPGPVAATAILGADLGLVILIGLIVSMFVAAESYFFVTRYASRTYIDPDPDGEITVEEDDAKDKPSALRSFLPVVVPLVLIVFKSISDFPGAPFGEGVAASVLRFIGEPVIALIIGMILSFFLPKKFDRELLSTTGWVGKSLTSAAVIIMITAAGGSFGMILRNSGIADILGESLAGANVGIWLPFIIAAALKSAQGSSTVAIVTTASLIAPMMEALGFVSPVGKALAVMSLCSGAMVMSHVNDSFFWVVTQLSGMNVKTGCKLHGLGTLLGGLTAMLVVWIGYMIFC
ncbi:MAG: GntP family permease [Bacteroides sp.]|nr:GntP family permease [Bacteroides sp.]MDD7490089.1 GntP family permease [Bacteroides sp.]MDY5891544.1 GntP family permease [Candidatus Cryptobacteroides sp.]